MAEPEIPDFVAILTDRVWYLTQSGRDMWCRPPHGFFFRSSAAANAFAAAIGTALELTPQAGRDAHLRRSPLRRRNGRRLWHHSAHRADRDGRLAGGDLLPGWAPALGGASRLPRGGLRQPGDGERFRGDRRSDPPYHAGDLVGEDPVYGSWLAFVLPIPLEVRVFSPAACPSFGRRRPCRTLELASPSDNYHRSGANELASPSDNYHRSGANELASPSDNYHRSGAKAKRAGRSRRCCATYPFRGISGSRRTRDARTRTWEKRASAIEVCHRTLRIVALHDVEASVAPARR
jgi:hypothetical protein